MSSLSRMLPTLLLVSRLWHPQMQYMGDKILCSHFLHPLYRFLDLTRYRHEITHTTALLLTSSIYTYPPVPGLVATEL